MACGMDRRPTDPSHPSFSESSVFSVVDPQDSEPESNRGGHRERREPLYFNGIGWRRMGGRNAGIWKVFLLWITFIRLKTYRLMRVGSAPVVPRSCSR